MTPATGSSDPKVAVIDNSAARKRACKPALALLFLIAGVYPAIWLASFTSDWFGAPDACDYAQMGRQILERRGMSTLQILPRHVRYLHDNQLLQAENWPNLYRYPLPTLVNAAFQRVIDDPVKAAIFQSGVSTWLLVIAVILLATRLADIRTGILAGLLVATDPLLWKLSYSGMTEPMASLLLIGVAYWTFANRSGSAMSTVALGGLCALAALNRTQLLVLLPWALVGYALVVIPRKVSNRDGSRTLLIQTGWILLGFVVVCSPWALRNMQITGSPFFSFSSTRNLLAGVVNGNFDHFLNAPYALSELITQYGSELPSKIWANLWPNAVSPEFWWARLGKYLFALPLALGAIFIWDRKTSPTREYRIFRMASLALWLGVFLVVSMAYHRHRFYVTLFPLLAIISARELAVLAALVFRRWEGRLGRVPISICAACALVLAVNHSESLSVTDPGLYGVPNSTTLRKMQDLREAIVPGRIVAAEESWNVALYANTRSLRMPIPPEDLLTIDRDYMPVDYVLIEPDYDRSLNLRQLRSTAEFQQSAQFQSRYRLAVKLRSGAYLYERRITSEPR
jgi:4-amino-4-deoxy-L-arabinose transferase-like glycosyltransferase